MPYNKAVKLHDLQNIQADIQMAEFALKAAQESNNWDCSVSRAISWDRMPRNA